MDPLGVYGPQVENPPVV